MANSVMDICCTDKSFSDRTHKLLIQKIAQEMLNNSFTSQEILNENLYIHTYVVFHAFHVFPFQIQFVWMTECTVSNLMYTFGK